MGARSPPIPLLLPPSLSPSRSPSLSPSFSPFPCPPAPSVSPSFYLFPSLKARVGAGRQGVSAIHFRQCPQGGSRDAHVPRCCGAGACRCAHVLSPLPFPSCFALAWPLSLPPSVNLSAPVRRALCIAHCLPLLARVLGDGGATRDLCPVLMSVHATSRADSRDSCFRLLPSPFFCSSLPQQTSGGVRRPLIIQRKPFNHRRRKMCLVPCIKADFALDLGRRSSSRGAHASILRNLRD